MKTDMYLRKELEQAYATSVKDNKKVFLIVNTGMEDSILPDFLTNKGEQTLDISPLAVRNLEFTPDYIEFSASFGKSLYNLSIPYDAAIALIEGD